MEHDFHLRIFFFFKTFSYFACLIFSMQKIIKASVLVIGINDFFTT
ncbi:hypothetical protein LEP1GSC103_3769 [Leptospira borgpetersenii serovar Javanica str. UI 09931]|uniref:Uncharacterized protein n=1 Tax=Leptospira borgpetersenii serovar Javanica str. UI 09931 TaxID=1049767 RepID=A0AAV3JF68_LEPBO|nr:hypothetical protein LEP1GSC066_1415 [Leptospira sp. serovar Kenya str. Sh9]EMN58414.1 hypothetical protein LEP1GSC090_3107 [Leptospira borgpetersenii serovar Javanica str. MK146]EPG59408.1 hypothetical protein LEP1GSC103_3769 [Leptospira borgpetersenii serovar Javanica str. UI 09931]